MDGRTPRYRKRRRDKFEGERGLEMEEVDTHRSLEFSLCEVIGGKIFVLRSHNAPGVG